MDNGIYIALSRQLALFRDMAETTNNIANTNTTGFQAERIMFSSYIKKDNNQGDKNDMAFANDVSNFRSTQEGTKRQTGNPLDVAIQGDGYFMIDTPLGVRYTRAGNFTLDNNGVLVNQDGYPVMDATGQHVEFPPDANDITIGTAGNISVNGQDFGTIGIALFDNQQLLTPSSGGLLKSDVPPHVGDADEIRVSQGVLENSNVQPVLEMTHMIDVSRKVSDTAKYIETLYDLQRKTTNAWTQQG